MLGTVDEPAEIDAHVHLFEHALEQELSLRTGCSLNRRFGRLGKEDDNGRAIEGAGVAR